MAIDPLDDMPKITLEKDDLESFQRNRAQSSKTTADKPSANVDDKVTHSRGPSWLMFVLLLGVVTAGGVYWAQQQHKAMQMAQQRISDLEGRLSATGEELDQSAVALGVKVSELSKRTDELWDQMDKLWASAWRRNQAEIADLNKALNSLKASTDKSLKALEGTDNDQQANLAGLSSQLTQFSNSLKQYQDSLGEIKLNTVNNEQQLASLREKLISSALGNNNLTNKVDDLESQIKRLEKSLAKPATSTTPTSP